ncbi:unnamed protein product [Ectocarpus sp. 12 AP-2014]
MNLLLLAVSPVVFFVLSVCFLFFSPSVSLYDTYVLLVVSCVLLTSIMRGREIAVSCSLHNSSAHSMFCIGMFCFMLVFLCPREHNLPHYRRFCQVPHRAPMGRLGKL